MPCRKKWSVGERKQFILLLRWVSVAHPGGSSSSYKQTHSTAGPSVRTLTAVFG